MIEQDLNSLIETDALSSKRNVKQGTKRFWWKRSAKSRPLQIAWKPQRSRIRSWKPSSKTITVFHVVKESKYSTPYFVQHPTTVVSENLPRYHIISSSIGDVLRHKIQIITKVLWFFRIIRLFTWYRNDLTVIFQHLIESRNCEMSWNNVSCNIRSWVCWRELGLENDQNTNKIRTQFSLKHYFCSPCDFSFTLWTWHRTLMKRKTRHYQNQRIVFFFHLS